MVDLYYSEGGSWIQSEVIGPTGPSGGGDGATGPTGPTGPKGDQGIQGAPGDPASGSSVPDGGATGQSMVKRTSANGDIAWEDRAKVTVSSSAPGSPRVGDIWVAP